MGERREAKEWETPKDKQAVSETNTDWEEEETKETPILQGKDDISKKFSLFLHFL